MLKRKKAVWFNALNGVIMLVSLLLNATIEMDISNVG